MASSQDHSPDSTGPRPSDTIAPQLERALQNLNVNLEDELTRYRRQRHGRMPPPPPPRRQAQRQTIDLISVPATASDTSNPPHPVPASAAPPPPPPPNPFLKGEGLDTDDPAADNELLAMEELLTPPGDAALGVSAGTDTSGADAASAASDLITPEAALQATETAPEGYLESSEELLKSLADEQAEPESVPEPYSPDRKNNGLLKLAGLILVLLGGIGVGFAITYPSQLQRLRSQLFPNGSDTAPSATTDTPDDTANTRTTNNSDDASADPEVAVDEYKPPGPDLSQREFVDLDLESLSTLDVDGSTPPVPAPPLSNPAQSPIPQSTPANQTQATPTQNTPAATAPDTTAATSPPDTPSAPPEQQPTSATPAAEPIAASTPTGTNFYVVASYTGDASLNKAREFVPDAFIRNFKAGARIQLAAFDNRAQAEDQVAFLTQQGITVELFGPTNE